MAAEPGMIRRFNMIISLLNPHLANEKQYMQLNVTFVLARLRRVFLSVLLHLTGCTWAPAPLVIVVLGRRSRLFLFIFGHGRPL